MHSLSIESLYGTYYDELFHYCARRVPVEDAEELMQELYLKLLTLPLHDIKQPRSYLYSLLNNMLIDLGRKQTIRHNTTSEDELNSEQVEGKLPTPETHTIDTQALQVLSQAITELPSEQQDLLILNRLEGLSLKQIASKKGRSLSWVEKAMSNALLFCKQRIMSSEDE